MPSLHCFSSDGRVVVLTGQRFTTRDGAPFGEFGCKQPRQVVVEQTGQLLAAWDVGTGKAVKSWDRTAWVRFLPNRPVLAIFEDNGTGGTRFGMWDFAPDKMMRTRGRERPAEFQTSGRSRSRLAVALHITPGETEPHTIRSRQWPS